MARERLDRLASASGEIRSHIARGVESFNGTPGVPASFDSLHELLERQAYRLSDWRSASHEINYRRFFDINALAALRIEDPEVFEATHALVRELLDAGQVDGLRIDHPDGLFDPEGVLREAPGAARGGRRSGPLDRRGEDPERRRNAARGMADRAARPGTPSRTT